MTGTRAWAARLTILLTLGFLALVAAALLWTTFMVYDDEGYVLHSLHAFVEHGHLYDQVYTQYGPFFFVLYRALHTLGLVFTNTTARAVTLVCWIGAVAACGGIVWRATRGSLLATVATLVATFLHLLAMSSEPSHPGGLIALLTAVAAWVGANPRWSSSARAAVVALIATMLVFTKINVGIFLFVAAGAWWLLQLPWIASRRGARWTVCGLIAIVPVALMHGSIGEPWVRTFMLVAGAAAAAVALVTRRGTELAVAGRDVWPALLAVAGVIALTVGVTTHTGTSARELLDGVILGPLRHPSLYWVPLTWRPGSVILAAVAVPLAVLSATRSSYIPPPWVVAARLALAVAYCACLVGAMPISAPAYVMSFGLATCWLFVLPTGENDPLHPVRSWLALVLVLQALHAFPVAGSQLSWGTFLWVPLMILGLVDAPMLLPSSSTRRIAAWACASAVLLIGANAGFEAWARCRSGEDLSVTGAEHLRLPARFTSSIRLLVRNAQVHGDVLFSLPGMLSFNNWTGIEPPTTAQATHWFNLLSPVQQDAIQRRLEAAPRGVIIVQRYVYDLINSQHFVTRTPLLRWIFENYQPVFKTGTYEFWARKGRAVVPVNAAHLYAGAKGTALRYKLEVVLAPDQPAVVSIVEIRQFMRDIAEPVARLDGRNTRFFAAPVDETGHATAPVAEMHLPFAAGALTRLELFTNDLPDSFARQGGELIFRDASGAKVAEARLSD